MFWMRVKWALLALLTIGMAGGAATLLLVPEETARAVPVPEETKLALDAEPRPLPLPLLEATQSSILREGRPIPMVTISRGPRHLLPAAVASPYQVLPTNRPADLLGQFLKAAPQEGPTSDRPTLVYLFGPRLDSNQRWCPVALSRQGNRFTLALESWTDDGPRRRNIPHHDCFLLTLGTLPAGQYELALEWKGFFLTYNRDKSTGLEQYAWTTHKKGKLAFTVADMAAKEVPTLDSLVEEKLPPEAGREYRQMPFFTVLRLQDGGRKDTPNPGLRVAATDLTQWLARKPANLGDFVQFASAMPPPVHGKYTGGVILGPMLSANETMTLREIAWRGTTCILRIDVWTSPQPAGERTWPVLVGLVGNSYFPPAGKTYDVELDWRYPGRDPALTHKLTADFVNQVRFEMKPEKP
jgi:hypothetical protein